MKRRERVRAVAVVQRDKSPTSSRVRVPGVVRDALGARRGDQMVFEEGCDAVVQRAALKGKYFVVVVERAVESADKSADEPVAHQQLTDSFADEIKRRLEERR